MVKIEAVNNNKKNKIVHDFMCMDRDKAMDPDTETFLIVPCSDLCCIAQVIGWACPLFSSLLVPLPAILFCWCKSMCDPAMLEISKITNRAAHRTSPRKLCSLQPKF